MTKIDIVSGFLGAGKTTLIKKLLAGPLKGQQIVLIENEFGEIGIDGGFMKDAGIEIREMNSGCICCSLVGDFATALKEVIDTYHPQRIVIEPSGVGKLSDVIKAVQDLGIDGVELSSFTTVADVNKLKMYIQNFGEFYNNQIQYARTIVLSRTDTPEATDEKVKAAVELIRSINPESVIITTPIEKLDAGVIMHAIENGRSDEDELFEQIKEEVAHHHHHHDHDGECCCGHDHDHDHEHHHHDHDGECCCGHDHDHDHDHDHEHHHHDHDGECCCGHHHDHDHDHDADEVFTSWGSETARKYSRDEIEGIMKALSADKAYGTVLRAKGMVDGKDGSWIYFDMVPEEYEVRNGMPQITGKFCVIGADLDEKKLAELFA